DYFPYINIQATLKPDNLASDQQNKAHFSPQSEPLAPPLAPPFLESQQSITPLSKQINQPTPQQYSSSVSSPYFQHGKFKKIKRFLLNYALLIDGFLY
ncbi:MAG: hypothetical protein ACK559_27495, partial [bacterium]